MLTKLQKRKLTRLFAMYDADCSGMLSRVDFEKIVQKLGEIRGWKNNSPEYNSLLNKYMYEWIHLKGEADRNRDQKVSLAEWLEYYDRLLEDPARYKKEVESLLASVFDVFDANGDGQIDRKEWETFFRVYNTSPVLVEDVFPTLDLNSDGFLDKEELLQMLHDFHYSDDPNAPGSSMFGPY